MCIPLQRRQESGSQFPTFTPPPSEIPIQIAGVSPWTVEYSVLNYLNAEESVQSVVFYADDDYLFQEQLGAKFYTFALNATLPGQYKLIRLTDAKGEGAVADDTFEISICPEAFWNRFPLEDDVSLSDSVTPSVTATTAVIGKDLKLTIDKSPLKKTICRNEEAEVELMAFGVPPLSVSFVRRVGNLPPENVTVSHLEAGKSGNLPQLGTSKSFISKIKLGTFETATEYRYYVTRVVDGRGVWTDYAQDFDADEFAVKVFER